MQKVLIDSSVWVSFLAEDANQAYATKIFRHLFSKKDQRKIIIPRIIYLEVINNILKLNLSQERILAFTNLLKNRKKIHLVNTDKRIYIKAEEYAKKVRLKTLDLLILTSAMELEVDKLISLDKKLKKEYVKLMTH